MNNIKRDLVLELFDYYPESGRLFWKETHPHWCKGREAGHIHHSGYRYVEINGTSYGVHRLVWLIEKGRFPGKGKEMDHIDGNRSYNRISNLREVTRQENTQNQKLRSTNNSGHLGVCWDKSRDRWLAYISHPNKGRVKLGLHRTLEAAIEARQKAEREYGYHENHGRAA